MARTYTITEIIGCLGLRVDSRKTGKTYVVIHILWNSNTETIEEIGIIREVIVLDLTTLKTKTIDYSAFVKMVNMGQLVISYFEAEENQYH